MAGVCLTEGRGDQCNSALAGRALEPVRSPVRHHHEADPRSLAERQPYAEKNLVISRLDHIARNEDILAKLGQTDWDLVVVDEAHKMSAHYFGNEVKFPVRSGWVARG